MNAECRKIRNQLPMALPGETELGVRRRIEEHLSLCSGCREEEDRRSSLLGRLAAEEVPDPGQVYWDSFLPRLRKRIASEGLPPGELLPAGNSWAVAASVALLLLGAAAALTLGPSPETGSRMALDFIAARTDPKSLDQVLEDVLPGSEMSRPLGISAGPKLPGAADLERALDSMLPPDEGDISGAVDDLSPEARRWLLRTLMPDRV